MAQDLEKRENYIKSKKSAEQREAAMLDHLLSLRERSKKTREKIFRLLDWLNPMSYIRKWRNSFRSKINDTLDNILAKSSAPSNSTDSEASSIENGDENINNSKSDFEKAEREQMDNMADDFFHLQNAYRQQLKHKHDSFSMKYPQLEKDSSQKNNLMTLAEKIAERQAQQGRLIHTDADELKKYNVDGENLVSGFRTAREALQKFLSSANHYKYLTGDFRQVGYAIRSGIEKRSGKKMYFLVVLFRNGKAQGSLPPTTPIPGKEKNFTPDQDTLEGWIGNRKPLQVAFEDLKKSLESSPIVELELELNTTATQQLQTSSKTNGMFVIRLKKNGFYQDYSVSDAPPLLQRVEETEGQKPQVFEVEFADLLTDFAELSEKHKDPSPRIAEEEPYS